MRFRFPPKRTLIQYVELLALWARAAWRSKRVRVAAIAAVALLVVAELALHALVTGPWGPRTVLGWKLTRALNPDRILQAKPGRCKSEAEFRAACGDPAAIAAWVSTNVKDEPSIAEWVAYHLGLGFDRVLVVDDHSAPPVYEVLSAAGLAFPGVVDVRMSGDPGAFHSKFDILKGIALPWAKKGAGWWIHLDADEYVHLRGGAPPGAPGTPADGAWPRTVQEYLACVDGLADAFPIRWELFGTAARESHPPGALVIESYTRAQSMAATDWWREYIGLTNYIGEPGYLSKEFLRPELAVDIGNPHAWALAPGARGLVPGTGHTMGVGPWTPYDQACGDGELISLAHYSTQDARTFKARKADRGTDDTGGFRVGLQQLFEDPPRARATLAAMYNDVEAPHLARAMATRTRQILACAQMKDGGAGDVSRLPPSWRVTGLEAACEALKTDLPSMARLLNGFRAAAGRPRRLESDPSPGKGTGRRKGPRDLAKRNASRPEPSFPSKLRKALRLGKGVDARH